MVYAPIDPDKVEYIRVAAKVVAFQLYAKNKEAWHSPHIRS